MNLNATILARAAVLGALAVVGCAPSSSSDVGAAGNASAGNASAGNASAGNASAGNTSGGSGTGGANAAGGKGNVNAGAGGQPNSAAGGDAGDGAATAGAAGTGGLTGLFLLDQSVPPTGTSGGYFHLSVSWTPGSGLLCKTTTSGVCSARVCAPPAADAGTPMIAALDAGPIHLTGAGASMITATYGPQSNGRVGYDPPVTMGTFYQPGDTLTLTGEGGADLPAFSAQTLVAPSDVVITAPACPAQTCPDLDRTQDLAVAWTGGVAGTVSVSVERDGPDTLKGVTCEFDAKAGSGSVPHTLLELLEPPTAADATGSLTILSHSVKQFTFGGLPNVFEVFILNDGGGDLTVSK